MGMEGRCRKCRRFLLAGGTCPNKCEQFAKPSVRVGVEAKRRRLERRHAAHVERTVGLNARDVGLPANVRYDIRPRIASSFSHPYLALRACPQCGSENFHPGIPGNDGRPAQCGDCGPILYDATDR